MEAAEYELQQRAGELEEEVAALRGELRAHSQREEREAVAAVRAGRETRALTARCTALTEQLAATEEKVASERATRTDLNTDLGECCTNFKAVIEKYRVAYGALPSNVHYSFSYIIKTFVLKRTNS